METGLVVDKDAGALADTPPGPGAADLSIELGGLLLTNPVMPASGCFGPELAPLFPLAALGAVVTKTVFAEHRAGNPAHRLTETSYGMLNSVGIPSPGSESFRNGLLRRYQESGTHVVVSIGGLLTPEYYTVAEDLAEEDIAAFEVNVSCPNLERGGLAIGTSPERVAEVVAGVLERVSRPVFVKLTPTVSAIGAVARAAEDAGAAAVTVANSFSGMSVNIHSRASTLGTGAGGYTGPGIKPLALKLVRDAAAAVDIPVIGCGGISTAEDVAEFLIAGATAVQVGTATFTRPTSMADIIRDLGPLCGRLGVSRVAELIGTLDQEPPTR
ncbi:dihydroorotate dehydrogenase [Cryobacterium tepidiphilum]|uniref:Dihydroorotate dehydrogenase n=1 Tax=Cryobacterium tepidiphilum TaxID=2486026 RepID=A0A3M8LEI2_9MICO|nr:dihydroorotate dehydrogenase [Cryobacterium tepidiphilum]RNE63963.1 dihydroorotate dehydrogenase [Cryobacterium tepidiphilum]